MTATVYVDASAIVRLVRDEPGSAELVEFLDGCEVVSSDVAIVETMRALRRHADVEGLDPDGADALAFAALEGMFLLVANAETLVRAGRYGGSMRALDAIHVASAEAVGAVDVFVTYDERQAVAARLAGLRTIAPGV